MTEFKGMQDMELQKRCLDAASEYLRVMYPALEDLERKHQILNACAAGFSKGYREAQAEREAKSEGVPG